MPQGYANEIHTSLSLLVPLNIRMNPLATFMYTVITLYFIFAEISLLSTNKFNIFMQRINYQTSGSRAVKMLEISQIEGFLIAQVSLTQETLFMVQINNTRKKRKRMPPGLSLL